MNYKISMRVFSVVYLIIGLAFILLSPRFGLQLFGVGAVPEPDIKIDAAMDFWRVIGFLRVFGGAFLMMGVMVGFLAYVEGDKNRKLVTSGISIGSILLFLIMFTQQTAFWGTIAGWILLTIVIITFVYFAVMSFRKFSSNKN